MICTEPSGPRAGIIHVGQATRTAGAALSVSLYSGSPAPTFTCFFNSSMSTAYSWEKVTGDNAIPTGISTSRHSLSGSKNLASSLTWNRPVQLDDSATYRCSTVNKGGTSAATLELSVTSVFVTR